MRGDPEIAAGTSQIQWQILPFDNLFLPASHEKREAHA